MYHWCDMSTWSKYRMCVAPYGSLQFCDFLCSILSFWVTLLAVAKMNRQLRFTMFITGVLALLLPVHMHRTGVAASIVPLVVGVSVVLISWVIMRFYLLFSFRFEIVYFNIYFSSVFLEVFYTLLHFWPTSLLISM